MDTFLQHLQEILFSERTLINGLKNNTNQPLVQMNELLLIKTMLLLQVF
jgi:hypothetical protein